MKRFARIILATLIVAFLSFATSSPVRADEPGELRVAAFRCDVTPPIGQPLYPHNVVRDVERPLLAKGIVLQSGNARYVICAVDACRIANASHLSLRRKLAAAAGTDVSRVAVQTVHQHSASWIDLGARNILAELDEDAAKKAHLGPKIIDEIERRIVKAVEGAIERMEPFDCIGTGQAKVDRVASNRRPVDCKGKVRTRYSRCKDEKIRAMPEGLIDPYLKTITFARGEKPLVRLHYYATHPQTRYGIDVASSDVVGQARETLEQREKVPQIYFTGCAGDIAVGKYNDCSDAARAGLAERLTAGMAASIAATEYMPAGPVRWRTCRLRLTPRTDAGFRLTDCIACCRNAKLDPIKRLSRGAQRVIFHGRSNLPIELSSLQIGDAHILHLPGEPMVCFQLYAQRLKPEEFVAVAGYGDGGPGYLCSKKVFSDDGGYEQTASNAVPESETKLKKAIATLLGVDKSPQTKRYFEKNRSSTKQVTLR